MLDLLFTTKTQSILGLKIQNQILVFSYQCITLINLIINCVTESFQIESRVKTARLFHNISTFLNYNR